MRRPPPSPDDPPRRPPAASPEDEQADLLAYAFRALGARAMTAHELRAKLSARCEDPERVDAVLARIQELGYQSDEQVAGSEGRRRGVGAFRVRQRLRQRGVDDALITETLAQRDPDEELADACRLLESRWPGLARKKDPRASAYALLARRGFGSAVIWEALRQVAAAQPPEDADAAWEEGDPA